MTLQETIARISHEHVPAKAEPFRAHSLARYIRGEAAKAVREALGELGDGLIVEGSAGAGNWAAVPWIAVFDPAVTETATAGYYVVYLFSVDGNKCFLSLNQGTTEARKQFGSDARIVLGDRAAMMRRWLADYAELLPAQAIDLGSNERLPGDYSAAHAAGFAYGLSDLSSDEKLRTDLHTVVKAYRALVFRGGPDLSVEPSQASDADRNVFSSLVEIRRYRMHKSIERNSRASRLAKQHHGACCQACGFSFSQHYGSIGDGYIEAHHLIPISSLEEGVKVIYDIPSDFAVLCSNCHRMIHRTVDPSDLAGFRGLLNGGIKTAK